MAYKGFGPIKSLPGYRLGFIQVIPGLVNYISVWRPGDEADSSQPTLGGCVVPPGPSGCFIMTLYKKSKSKLGWTVQLGFVIGLHEKDRSILESIQTHWGAAVLRKPGKIYKLGVKSI